jgi:hypothetical protein
MRALILGAVPPSETGSANGFNTLMRSIGTSTSAAVVALVLAHLTTNLGGHPVASLAGFRTGMPIGCGASLVAAIALTIPARRGPGVNPVMPRQARAGRLTRGLAGDQLGLEHDALVGMQVRVVAGLLHQERRGRAPHLHGGLAYGGERHSGGRGELDVVVADHCDLVRHGDLPSRLCWSRTQPQALTWAFEEATIGARVHLSRLPTTGHGAVLAGAARPFRGFEGR